MTVLVLMCEYDFTSGWGVGGVVPSFEFCRCRLFRYSGSSNFIR